MASNPYMIMMVGISGSGKSTLARHIAIDNDEVFIRDDINNSGNPVIHSSDDLREELYGDANNQEHNDELFIELHRRIKSDLRAGKNVIYDATNINKKLRVSFLNELKNIQCCKVCIAVMTPLEDCLKNNANRERKVPERAIRKMYKNWQPPHYHEGFDMIHFSFLLRDGEEMKQYRIADLYETMNSFDQENEHHSLSLGGHCSKALNYIAKNYGDNDVLLAAAALHDIGKLETKVRINRRGIDDGNCHYYQHQCVGAYMAVFYLAGKKSAEDIVDIINIIYFHMNPYMSWKQSEKAKEKDKRLIGDKLFNDIMALHEADISAH